MTISPEFFGASLRRLREKRGLNIHQLSERSGLHQSTISRLETDSQRLPNTATFLQLAKGFGLTMQELAVLTDLVEPLAEDVMLVKDPLIKANYRLLHQENITLLQALESAEPLTRHYLLQLIQCLTAGGREFD